ncbi:hypothetical protein [Shivajiella indica]|uniref:Uncharacterized protein n=1 Tax=Shivajiella indica TaxID=872115 RepID=A0ABW5B2V4_9BACT
MIVVILLPNLALAQDSQLFENDDVLEITLSGDLDGLFKNRSGEAKYFELNLIYQDSENQRINIPLKGRTRGKFRRKTGICKYPPILLNFNKEGVKNTLFEGQDKLKLVMPCKGDKYVLNEYFTYKIYNLLTDYSFRVRLLKVNLEDSDPKSKKEEIFYAFVLEEEEQMAERNNMVALGQDLIRPNDLYPAEFLKMTLFQFLIGNTDWSVQYRQNIKLLKNESNGLMIGVPYDFDHAGIVSAPYAKPAEELLLRDTKERRYRGYCIPNMASFDEVFAFFNDKKEDIYAIYTKNSFLEESYIKSTIKFLDEFYKTINNPKYAQTAMQYPCDPDGTGNVVIKGLREN